MIVVKAFYGVGFGDFNWSATARNNRPTMFITQEK